MIGLRTCTTDVRLRSNAYQKRHAPRVSLEVELIAHGPVCLSRGKLQASDAVDEEMQSPA